MWFFFFLKQPFYVDFTVSFCFGFLASFLLHLLLRWKISALSPWCLWPVPTSQLWRDLAPLVGTSIQVEVTIKSPRSSWGAVS